MQDLFLTFFGNLRDYESLSPQLLPLTGLFATMGGLILTRHTGSIGNATLPLNVSALFIGAMLANWLAQNVKLPLESTVETPLVMSLVGMTLAALLMLRWLQGNAVRH